jgi:predicted nucleic-acid-binding protein
MRAVDTNVLVRLIVRDDEQQVRKAEEFVAPGAWVSLVTLVETVWALSSIYEFRSKDLARLVAMLTQHPNLTLQDSDAVESALAVFQAQPAVEFSDCLILELGRKNGHLPLGRFDRKLAGLA